MTKVIWFRLIAVVWLVAMLFRLLEHAPYYLQGILAMCWWLVAELEEKKRRLP